jgi:ribosome-associated translation inhibitor RaiA
MIRIVFKNLEESELAKEATLERMQTTIDRFPDLKNHRITVTLSMDNSPLKPGPDVFKVKMIIVGKKYEQIALEKSAMSLYVALADVVEHALERLNRFGDKKRVKQRNHERRLLHKLHTQEGEMYEKNRG